jgi:membrane protease YdiL (CAAX protease family)
MTDHDSPALASWPTLTLEPDVPDADPPGSSGWTPLSALLALFIAVIGGTIAGALVAVMIGLAFGLNVTGNNLAPGLQVVATVVQDAVFVGAAVFTASRFGGRPRPEQFGLRTTSPGPAIGLIIVLYVAFLVVTVLWQAAFNDHTPEKLLDQLGANENAALLVAAAILTCVVAPFCEEFLFRGYIFTALRNWRGPWPAAVLTGLVFGGVHVLSAPIVDLLPLAFLGFGLCLLYWFTRSLLPGIATHSINNSVAFAALEHWAAIDYLLLVVGALTVLGTIAVVLRSRGVIVSGTAAPDPVPAG